MVREVHAEAVRDGLVENDGRCGELPELMRDGSDQLRAFFRISCHGLDFVPGYGYYLSS
jgi:hypothetical protein